MLLFLVPRNRSFTSLNNYQARSIVKDIHFNITKLEPRKNRMMNTVRLVSHDLFSLQYCEIVANEQKTKKRTIEQTNQEQIIIKWKEQENNGHANKQ
jgi:hypothetical protein